MASKRIGVEPVQIHKTHWDFLLQEANWMSVDFYEERKWKVHVSQLLAHQAAAKVEVRSRQKVARQSAAMIAQFWVNIASKHDDIAIPDSLKCKFDFENNNCVSPYLQTRCERFLNEMLTPAIKTEKKEHTPATPSTLAPPSRPRSPPGLLVLERTAEELNLSSIVVIPIRPITSMHTAPQESSDKGNLKSMKQIARARQHWVLNVSVAEQQSLGGSFIPGLLTPPNPITDSLRSPECALSQNNDMLVRPPIHHSTIKHINNYRMQQERFHLETSRTGRLDQFTSEEDRSIKRLFRLSSRFFDSRLVATNSDAPSIMSLANLVGGVDGGGGGIIAPSAASLHAALVADMLELSMGCRGRMRANFEVARRIQELVRGSNPAVSPFPKLPYRVVLSNLLLSERAFLTSSLTNNASLRDGNKNTKKDYGGLDPLAIAALGKVGLNIIKETRRRRETDGDGEDVAVSLISTSPSSEDELEIRYKEDEKEISAWDKLMFVTRQSKKSQKMKRPQEKDLSCSWSSTSSSSASETDRETHDDNFNENICDGDERSQKLNPSSFFPSIQLVESIAGPFITIWNASKSLIPDDRFSFETNNRCRRKNQLERERQVEQAAANKEKGRSQDDDVHFEISSSTIKRVRKSKDATIPTAKSKSLLTNNKRQRLLRGTGCDVKEAKNAAASLHDESTAAPPVVCTCRACFPILMSRRRVSLIRKDHSFTLASTQASRLAKPQDLDNKTGLVTDWISTMDLKRTAKTIFDQSQLLKASSIGAVRNKSYEQRCSATLLSSVVSAHQFVHKQSLTSQVNDPSATEFLYADGHSNNPSISLTGKPVGSANLTSSASTSVSPKTSDASPWPFVGSQFVPIALRRLIAQSVSLNPPFKARRINSNHSRSTPTTTNSNNNNNRHNYIQNESVKSETGNNALNAQQQVNPFFALPSSLISVLSAPYNRKADSGLLQTSTTTSKRSNSMASTPLFAVFDSTKMVYPTFEDPTSNSEVFNIYKQNDSGDIPIANGISKDYDEDDEEEEPLIAKHLLPSTSSNAMFTMHLINRMSGSLHPLPLSSHQPPHRSSFSDSGAAVDHGGSLLTIKDEWHLMHLGMKMLLDAKETAKPSANDIPAIVTPIALASTSGNTQQQSNSPQFYNTNNNSVSSGGQQQHISSHLESSSITDNGNTQPQKTFYNKGNANNNVSSSSNMTSSRASPSTADLQHVNNNLENLNSTPYFTDQHSSLKHPLDNHTSLSQHPSSSDAAILASLQQRHNQQQQQIELNQQQNNQTGGNQEASSSNDNDIQLSAAVDNTTASSDNIVSTVVTDNISNNNSVTVTSAELNQEIESASNPSNTVIIPSSLAPPPIKIPSRAADSSTAAAVAAVAAVASRLLPTTPSGSAVASPTTGANYLQVNMIAVRTSNTAFTTKEESISKLASDEASSNSENAVGDDSSNVNGDDVVGSNSVVKNEHPLLVEFDNKIDENCNAMKMNNATISASKNSLSDEDDSTNIVAGNLNLIDRIQAASNDLVAVRLPTSKKRENILIAAEVLNTQNDHATATNLSSKIIGIREVTKNIGSHTNSSSGNAAAGATSAPTVTFPVNNSTSSSSPMMLYGDSFVSNSTAVDKGRAAASAILDLSDQNILDEEKGIKNNNLKKRILKSSLAAVNDTVNSSNAYSSRSSLSKRRKYTFEQENNSENPSGNNEDNNNTSIRTRISLKSNNDNSDEEQFEKNEEEEEVEVEEHQTHITYSTNKKPKKTHFKHEHHHQPTQDRKHLNKTSEEDDEEEQWHDAIEEDPDDQDDHNKHEEAKDTATSHLTTSVATKRSSRQQHQKQSLPIRHVASESQVTSSALHEDVGTPNNSKKTVVAASLSIHVRSSDSSSVLSSTAHNSKGENYKRNESSDTEEGEEASENVEEIDDDHEDRSSDEDEDDTEIAMTVSKRVRTVDRSSSLSTAHHAAVAPKKRGRPSLLAQRLQQQQQQNGSEEEEENKPSNNSNRGPADIAGNRRPRRLQAAESISNEQQGQPQQQQHVQSMSTRTRRRSAITVASANSNNTALGFGEEAKDSVGGIDSRRTRSRRG